MVLGNETNRTLVDSMLAIGLLKATREMVAFWLWHAVRCLDEMVVDTVDCCAVVVLDTTALLGLLSFGNISIDPNPIGDSVENP